MLRCMRICADAAAVAAATSFSGISSSLMGKFASYQFIVEMHSAIALALKMTCRSIHFDTCVTCYAAANQPALVHITGPQSCSLLSVRNRKPQTSRGRKKLYYHLSDHICVAVYVMPSPRRERPGRSSCAPLFVARASEASDKAIHGLNFTARAARAARRRIETFSNFPCNWRRRDAVPLRNLSGSGTKID